jgi:hypothetical protein
VYRPSIPFSASNTDAWTIAPTRIDCGGGRWDVSSAPIIVRFQSMATLELADAAVDVLALSARTVATASRATTDLRRMS